MTWTSILRPPRPHRPRRPRLIRRTIVALLLALFALRGGPAPAGAAGLLIADGGFGGALEIVDHDVLVTVDNGIAVTKVTQVFRNKERRQLEALYTFPVPKGASVADFSMWINGKEMVGEVVEKERARQIYESYKQTKRDPGLLEQVDYKTFEMRVFPIGPEAEQRLQITYYQELDVDQDWSTYVYPLATVSRAGADVRTAGRFALNLEARSAVPIAAMESPSHDRQMTVARHADTYWQASLERTAGTNLDRDVVVAFRLSRPQTGIDLVAHRGRDDEGTFSLILTPGEETAALDEGMDYVFIMDVSGSMGSDGKLLVSKDSVLAFVRELEAKNRFEVMAFNVQPTVLFSRLEPAGPDAVQRAGAFVDGQQARGGTVLNPALDVAYRYHDADRTLNVVLLSDGMTEQGERAALLEQIQKRPGNTRVFCIGVGNEGNRPLLEQLAQDSGGLAAFISRGDNFERQARAFRRKLQHPVATGLALDVRGVDVSDLEPPVLPNLYHGTPVRVYSRYRGSGPAMVRLTGDVRGVRIETAAELAFPAREDGNPEIERRNVLLSARDRKERERLRASLDGIRQKAVAGLGSEAAKPLARPNAAPVSPAAPAPTQPAGPPSTGSAPPPDDASRSRGFDINLGSGPVGPVFLAAAAWLNRRRRRKADA